MAEVDLHLDGITAPELLAVSARLVAGLDRNPSFLNPTPSLSELRRLIAAMEDAQEEYRQLRLRLNDMKAARDIVMDLLKAALHEEAEYVQEASGGDVERIMSAGIHAERRTFLWPFRTVGQVVELSAGAGDEPGEVDLVWDRVRGATGYEVQICFDGGAADEWAPRATTVQSRASIQGLQSRLRYWFRVRAVSKRGDGEWSDPVTKFAP